ncbi:PTS system mannose/fructose/sorbose family transporter subunit IID [Nitratidesulfovibrio sp. D1]|uniref:PTS system mannose/fructose/sorbose family transporter subunit IID n=1 Tax=Nitratidesulfovibrio sp. D1 TaxID=3440151 RepID=UPI003EBC97B0
MPTPAPSMPDAKTLLLCFLRSYLVGAAFNTRGHQNIGIVFAMEPGLAAIYPDPRARREARKRYLRHFNTHPFWAPLLVGTFLSLEARIARGTFPAEVLRSLKDTTVYTLSAIGDSVFGGSMLVFWSLTTCALVVSGNNGAAFLWSLMLFVSLQVFKLFTFAAGLREGLKVLQRLKQWDLINWGEKLKLCNAVVLAGLLWLIWPHHQHATRWTLSALLLMLASWLIGRFHVSRIFLAACATAAAFALPWADDWMPMPWGF